MTDQELDQCFRQDILDNPLDDAPRMAYADWLQDGHDPLLGRFIALQLQIHARSPAYHIDDHASPDICRHSSFEDVREAREILDQLLRRDYLFLGEYLIWSVRRVWRRGFVESVSVPQSGWKQACDKLKKLPAQPAVVSLSKFVPGQRHGYVYLRSRPGSEISYHEVIFWSIFEKIDAEKVQLNGGSYEACFPDMETLRSRVSDACLVLVGWKQTQGKDHGKLEKSLA